MSVGWIVEIRGRRPCHTLMTTRHYVVPVEDRHEAACAVAILTKDLRDIQVTPRTRITSRQMQAFGLLPGDEPRYLPSGQHIWAEVEAAHCL